MSLRILGCLSLVITVAALTTPLPAAGQTTQAATKPVWEYRVVELDPSRCASAEAMAATMNANGRQGWELVGYQAGPPQFPGTIEGSVLIRPAAPDAARPDLYPHLVGFFQGSVSLKMPQAQAGACQLVFKRQVEARP